MTHPEATPHDEPNGSLLAPALILLGGVLAGAALGLALLLWVFDRTVGWDAAGIFLLGVAAGLVLTALVGSQLTRIPLWFMLVAGQVMALSGLLLLLL